MSRSIRRRVLSIAVAIAMLLGMVPVISLPAGAASATDYTDAGATSYTASARVDESVGMRGTVTINNGTSNVSGITKEDPGMTDSLDVSDVSSITITATPLDYYNFEQLTVAAFAQITHADGTIEAVQDVQTSTNATWNYNIPDFTGYVTDGDSVNVDISVYADFAYNYDLVNSWTTNVITLDASTTNRLIDIDLSDYAGDNVVVRITGTISKDKQVYIHNDNYGNERYDVHVILEDVIWLKGPNGLTIDNYTYYNSSSGNAAANGGFNGRGTAPGSSPIVDGERVLSYRTSNTTRSYGSHIVLADVDAYVTLVGENILSNNWSNLDGGTNSGAAINVDASASLIITDASETAGGSRGSLFAQSGSCSSAIGTAGVFASGYVEIDGGDVTAWSAWGWDSFAGIGNGGHYEDVRGDAARDPGSRGIVINGGKVHAFGTHYGIGAQGGDGTDEGVEWPMYVVITGGTVLSEASTASGGAAIGCSRNNVFTRPETVTDNTKINQVRIGRPDKEDSDTNVTAINWGFGAAISGQMTFYSGSTGAYSGQYAAAIGGNASTSVWIDRAYSNALRDAVNGTTHNGAGPQQGAELTVYGGNVTAIAGAFENLPVTTSYFNSTNGDPTVSGIIAGRGLNDDGSATRTDPLAVIPQDAATWDPNTYESYGAAIGGPISQGGAARTKLFGGDFTVVSSKYGAGIGGGGGMESKTISYSGGGSVSGSVAATARPAGSGGLSSQSTDPDTGELLTYTGGAWLGSQTDLQTGEAVSMNFTIRTGEGGAGIGGGGVESGSTQQAGNGGDLYITGGVFDIQSGIYGAGIGGGGGNNAPGGDGGDVTITADTYSPITPAEQMANSITIQSGQYGAAIGGGGSVSGNGGDGAANLQINSGTFDVESGAGLAAGQRSYGAGIGGGGSYSGTGGAGPTRAQILGGYFTVLSGGYGSAIGGGGTETGTGGGCGTIQVLGGTITAENRDTEFAEQRGLRGLGGGASASGTSNVTDGTVVIAGGNVYTTAGTNIVDMGGTAGITGQHVWTRPNYATGEYDETGVQNPSYDATADYTSEEWDFTTLPTFTGGEQDIMIENTAQEGLIIGGIAPERIGMQIYQVSYVLPNSAGTGTIRSAAYGTNDTYIVEGADGNGEVSVWVPAAYRLTYNLVNGTGATGTIEPQGTGGSGPVTLNPGQEYVVEDSLEYAFGQINLILSSDPGDANNVYQSEGQVKLLPQDDDEVTSGLDYMDGLYADQTDYVDKGLLFRQLITHADAELPTGHPEYEAGVEYPVIFAGWTTYAEDAGIGGTETIYVKEWGATPRLATTVQFSQADIEVYAVYGYDLNRNGIADINETPTTVTYDANGGDADTVPAAQSGLVGESVNIPDVTPSHDPATTGSETGDVIFVGWTSDTGVQGSIVTVNNYDDAPYATILDSSSPNQDLYLYGGGKYFGIYRQEGQASYTLKSQTGDTLYAVWALDSNHNQVPDYLEALDGGAYTVNYNNVVAVTDSGTSAAPTMPTHSSQYVEGNQITETDLEAGPTATGEFQDGSGNKVLFLYWTADRTAAEQIYTYEEEGQLPARVVHTFGEEDLEVYAVWSTDLDGNGEPDVTQQRYTLTYADDTNLTWNATSGQYELPTPVTGIVEGTEFAWNPASGQEQLDNSLLGRWFANGAGNEYYFAGWTDDRSVAGMYDDADHWNSHFASDPTTPTYSGYPFCDNGKIKETVTIQGDTMLYAVWFLDNDQNEAPDFLDPNAGSRGDNYVFYAVNEVTLAGHGGQLDLDSRPYPENEGTLAIPGNPSYTGNPEHATYDDHGGVGYAAGTSVSLSSAEPVDMTSNWIFAGWTPLWTTQLYYSSGDLEAFVQDLLLIQDIEKGTNKSGANIQTGTTPYPDESSIGELWNVVQGDSDFYNAFDPNTETLEDFVARFDWSSYNFEKHEGFLRSIAVPGVDLNSGTRVTTHAAVYPVWVEDSNNNGTPDFFEATYRIDFEAIGANYVPGPMTDILENEFVNLPTGREESGVFMQMTKNDGNGDPMLFLGWTQDANVDASGYGYGDTAPADTALSITVTGNLTLYAVWAIDANGNNVPDMYETAGQVEYHLGRSDATGAPTDMTVYSAGEYAQLIDTPAPTIPGNDRLFFVGWTLEEQNGQFYGDPSLPTPPSAMTDMADMPELTDYVYFAPGVTVIHVYAVWGYDSDGDDTPDVNEERDRTVHYDGNGNTRGTAPADQTVPAGTATVTVMGQGDLMYENDPHDHIFLGWTTLPQAQGYVFGAGDTSPAEAGLLYGEGETLTVGRDLTLYAVWAEDTNGNGIPDLDESVTYTVTYQPDNGMDAPTYTQVANGTSITIAAAPTAPVAPIGSRYEFLGWLNQTDNVTYQPGNLYTVTGNVTFVAQWRQITDPAPTTVTVTYHANNGSGDTVSAVVNAGETATLQANTFTWSGYTFTGWNTRADGSGQGYQPGDTIASLSADFELYAQWQENGGGVIPPPGSGIIVTVNPGVGGSTNPTGSVTVQPGDNLTITITPDDGYVIEDVIVGGVSRGPVSSVTLENIQGNVSVEVIFREEDTPGEGDLADPDDTGVSEWLETVNHIAYLNGYGELFAPSANMTRAEVAQMFYNLLLEQNVTITTSFSDVPADAWYATAVNTLASLGIIQGYGEGIFAPDETITRAEFTAIAMRFTNGQASNTENRFTDVDAGDWYYEAVLGATGYGWIQGYGELFAPEATITRAEVTAITNRMLGRVADRAWIDANEGSLTVSFTDNDPSNWAYYDVVEATNAHGHTGTGNDETWTGLE